MHGQAYAEMEKIMQVIEVVFPVLAMIALGIMCRRMHFISREGIDNIKFLVTKIVLPVAIFHALGTVEYSARTFILIGIMLVMLVVSFGIGYLLRPLMPEPYRKYVPFMVSVYEGGMMAYPLFANLCGQENLSQIALLDIAGLLFGFSIYMGLLEQVENGKTQVQGREQVKLLLLDALHNPAFIAALLGIIVGVSGLLEQLIASGAGEVYLKTEAMITAPLSSIILLVVGYDLAPDLKLIGPCIRTILLRFALQAVMICGVILAAHKLVGIDSVMTIAIISYMSAPATFSMQSFLKTEEGSSYAATTNSCYCLVSIGVYAVLAGMM